MRALVAFALLFSCLENEAACDFAKEAAHITDENFSAADSQQ
jgi:hypothetical protein